MWVAALSGTHFLKINFSLLLPSFRHNAIVCDGQTNRRTDLP